MKKLALISGFVFLSAFSLRPALSQTATLPIDEDTKLITYKDIVWQEGESSKLYTTAVAWINANYKNPNEVTTVREPENGKLVLNPRFKIFNVDKKGLQTDGGIIKYTLKLEFKPNRYRYVFTDFNLQAVSKFPLERWLNKNDPQYTPACDNYLYQVDTTVNGIIKSLKKGMIPKAIKTDEW
ncbi:MAG TPA: DUF4468 domain-containing protein [Bacteroidales bacterium]|nr:DUF4468 domain-containing protein [Bacteroidales bacterium]HQI69938.1 DUF4468 domain-containing protein [Bacteroidales bacterium]